MGEVDVAFDAEIKRDLLFAHAQAHVASGADLLDIVDHSPVSLTGSQKIAREKEVGDLVRDLCAHFAVRYPDRAAGLVAHRAAEAQAALEGVAIACRSEGARLVSSTLERPPTAFFHDAVSSQTHVIVSSQLAKSLQDETTSAIDAVDPNRLWVTAAWRRRLSQSDKAFDSMASLAVLSEHGASPGACARFSLGILRGVRLLRVREVTSAVMARDALHAMWEAS